MAAAMLVSTTVAMACTNFIVTPGASTDGSTICTYNADDYGMFASSAIILRLATPKAPCAIS